MENKIKKLYDSFINYYNEVKDEYNYVKEKSQNINIIFNGIIEKILDIYENEINKEIIVSDEYFFNESFLKIIFNKIEFLIEYINIIFYKVFDQDVDLFDQYLYIIYYISILEDLVVFIKDDDANYNSYQEEIKYMNDVIFNKLLVTDELINQIDSNLQDIEDTYPTFYPSVLIFEICNKEDIEDIDFSDEDMETLKDEFLNNSESYIDLINHIKDKDLTLHFHILALENVILNLFLYYDNNKILIIDEEEYDVNSLLIDMTHLYNIYLLELHRIYDLYGIDILIKYKECIYYGALINNLILLFSDEEDYTESLNCFTKNYEIIFDETHNIDVEDLIMIGENIVESFSDRYKIINKKFPTLIDKLYNYFK